MKITDTRNWQININNPSTIVEGIDDIAQCIYVILNTIPGSDPLRPTFGSNVYQYIDRPMNEVQSMLIYGITESIKKWEKRIKINKCLILSNGTASRILKLDATVIASAAPITLNINI